MSGNEQTQPGYPPEVQVRESHRLRNSVLASMAVIAVSPELAACTPGGDTQTTPTVRTIAGSVSRSALPSSSSEAAPSSLLAPSPSGAVDIILPSVGQPNYPTSSESSPVLPSPTDIFTVTPSTSVSVAPPKTSTPPPSLELPPGTSKHDQIARTFIVGFDAKNYSADQIIKVIRDTKIGGVYLTDTKNGNSIYQKIKATFGSAVTCYSDEEGGIVHRLSYPFNFPSAKEMGKMTTDQVTLLAKRAGAIMRKSGVTVDLAPVLDLDDGKSDGAISGLDRSFGGSLAHIAKYAAAFKKGLLQSGVMPVLKHFPGIGLAKPNSDTDSHKATGTLTTEGVAPYQTILRASTAADLPPIMLSNMYVTNIDSKNPADVSLGVVNFVRKNGGYSGIITTDDLGAIGTYDGKTLSQNIVAAERAGVTAPLFNYAGESKIQAAISQTRVTISQDQINKSLSMILALQRR